MKRKYSHYKKAHAYTILSYSPNFVFLMVFPVLQSMLFNPDSILEIIANYGFTLLFLILVFTSITLEYRSILYTEKEDRLYTKKGFFYIRKSDIPYVCVQSVNVEKRLFPRIFGAYRLSVHSPGSFTPNGDFSLYLRKKNAEELNRKIFGTFDGAVKYKGGFFRIILMAASWSNALTGLLILAPVLYRQSTQTGIILRDYFMQRMDISNYIIKTGVPPALSGLATALIVCWGIAYVFQLARYAFFSLEIKDNIIRIRRGLINRNEFITKTEKICAIQIRQSLLMLVLNLRSAYIKTIGSGVRKGDKSLLIPADKKKNINNILGRITSLPTTQDYKIKPGKRVFMSYLWLPFFCIVGTVAVMFILDLLGYFGEIVSIPLAVLLLVFVVWFFFRILCWKKSDIIICDKAVQIDYFYRINLTRTYIPYSRIQFAEVYQSVFQRAAKTATIKIYVYSNKRSSYKIKHLSYPKLLEAVDIIETKMKYYKRGS